MNGLAMAAAQELQGLPMDSELDGHSHTLLSTCCVGAYNDRTIDYTRQLTCKTCPTGTTTGDVESKLASDCDCEYATSQSADHDHLQFVVVQSVVDLIRRNRVVLQGHPAVLRHVGSLLLGQAL